MRTKFCVFQCVMNGYFPVGSFDSNNPVYKIGEYDNFQYKKKIAAVSRM